MNCEGDFIPINIDKILSKIHLISRSISFFRKSHPKSFDCHEQRLSNPGNETRLFQCKLTTFIKPRSGKQPLGYSVKEGFHHNEEESMIMNGIRQSTFEYAAALGPESENAQHQIHTK
jgi:hypothetical protein